MYIDRKDIIEYIDDMKDSERKLVRLNGNNQKAIIQRFEALERHQQILTEEYNKEAMTLELRKIALYELLDEYDNKDNQIKE